MNARHVELWTASGDFVAIVEVLPFPDERMPVVVTWGVRAFVRSDPAGEGGRWVYNEVFAYASITPSPGLPREAA